MISPTQIRSNWLLVPTTPIVYTWWFDEIPQLLLNQVPGISKMLQKQIVNGKDYYALYFGIANNGRERMKWHIEPSVSHSCINVKSGRISTLRQTISALLCINQSGSELAVNNYMDTHCLVDWCLMPSRQDAESVETLQICQYIYPLNIAKNKQLALKQWLDYLKKIRKQYKQ